MEFSTLQSRAVESSIAGSYVCGANSKHPGGSGQAWLGKVTTKTGEGEGEGGGWETTSFSSPFSVYKYILSPKGSCQAHRNYRFSLDLDLH